MNKDLLKVSIRQNAIYLPLIEEEKKQEELTSTTIALVAQLRKVGYSLSEELLHAVNQLYPAQQMMILQVMKEAFLRRRDLICNLLRDIEGMKVRVPQGAFYVMPDISSFLGKSDGNGTINNSNDLAIYLLDKAQVAVVGGDAFGAPECIRISYATSDELLVEAAKRIKSALSRLK